MTKTRPFLSMCYGDPSATEVPPCCETATTKLTFSTTSVLLLLNMPLSLSRATIFRRQKNPRRVYRPKIAGILFVCNEPEGKYYTVPNFTIGVTDVSPSVRTPASLGDSEYTVCALYRGPVPAAQTVDIQCSTSTPVRGRYLFILRKGSQFHIQLCELEVYAWIGKSFKMYS